MDNDAGIETKCAPCSWGGGGHGGVWSRKAHQLLVRQICGGNLNMFSRHAGCQGQ